MIRLLSKLVQNRASCNGYSSAGIVHMVGWCPDYGAGDSQQNPQDSDHTHAMQDSQ